MHQPQLSLFRDSQARPDGLAYQPEFVSAETERALVARIGQLPLTPFRFGQFEGRRRTVSFGWKYDFSSQKLQKAEPIPDWIKPVIDTVEQFGRLSPGSISHVLLTEYEAGAGIGWHRDKKEFGTVFGLSLASACNLRFRKKVGAKWQRYALFAEPRSLYTLAGEARHVWQHSILAVDALRYSITFRTLAGRCA